MSGPSQYKVNEGEDCNDPSHGLYGGTTGGLISLISQLGAEYLNSYRGFDNTGDDGALHNTLRKIQSGEKTDMDSIDWVHCALDYRMTQMSTADEYLQMMDVAAPKGQPCCEYNTYRIRQEIGEDKYSMILGLIFAREILFPAPLESQGRPFYKGHHYLVAAFHHANTSNDVVVKKVDALVALLDQSLEQKEMVRRDPQVSSKRRKLF